MSGYSDDAFRVNLTKGYLLQLSFARFLQSVGVKASVAPYRFRESKDQIEEFKADNDVTTMAGVVEVKGRNRPFTRPADLPFDDFIVMEVDQFDAKITKPSAVVCISRITGCPVWTSVAQRDEWTTKWIRDPERKHTHQYYMAKRENWHPINRLVDILKARQNEAESPKPEPKQTPDHDAPDESPGAHTG